MTLLQDDSRLNMSDYGSVERLASAGEDWFVRMREAASAWEKVEVELTGAIRGKFPMSLQADGSWRALVMIPTNAAGTCSFVFVAIRLIL